MAVCIDNNSSSHLWSHIVPGTYLPLSPFICLFVCFCNPVRYKSFIFYRRDKWCSSWLSNWLKFIYLVRDRIRLWHMLPKTVPSVLPGRAKGPSSQKRTDDHTHEIADFVGGTWCYKSLEPKFKNQIKLSSGILEEVQRTKIHWLATKIFYRMKLVLFPSR